MDIKPRTIRSKFRTFRIWVYILFGFSFFFFSAASAFASSFPVYTLPGPVTGSTAQSTCDSFNSKYNVAPFSVVSSVASNVTSSSFVCTVQRTNGIDTFTNASSGTISSVSCTSPQVYDYSSGTCAVPPTLPVGSPCDPTTGSFIPDWPGASCTPAGQTCLASGSSVTINGVTSAIPNVYYINVSPCTYDPNNPSSYASDPKDLSVAPPIDPSACGAGSVQVGASCYPVTGSQCGSLNGVTVCAGGSVPKPATSVSNDANGSAVQTSLPPPPPTYSGSYTASPDTPPTPFDVYDGFTQGGGGIPTAPSDGSGNCPPGYGKITNGTTTVCIKNGTSGDGSGVGDSSGSGSNSPDQSSHCGGAGQPACGGEPDSGGACPSGTSQITVDRGKNGTDSVCVPVADPNSIDTSGLDQTGAISSFMTPPSLSSLDLGQTCACPAPYQFSVFGVTLSIPFSPFCDLADMIRPLFIFMAWISLYFAVVRVLR